MPDATVLPQARFARAKKKARRAQQDREAPAVAARPDRIPPPHVCARTIRERFGARWLTIPPYLYPQLFNRIAHSPGTQPVYSDANYWVIDLGKP